MKKSIYVLMSILIIASMLAGCATKEPTKAPPTNTPVPPTATTVAIKAEEAPSTPVPTVPKSKYNEAPKLKALVDAGELPSPIDPPSGCRCHTRCPHATPACAQSTPQLEPARGDSDHQVACLRVDELRSVSA